MHATALRDQGWINAWKRVTVKEWMQEKVKSIWLHAWNKSSMNEWMHATAQKDQE